MNLLDMRTVIFSYAISNFICMIVMARLWQQNRARFDGLGFWLTDVVLQFAALGLIALRGAIPDLLSMTGSNALAISGTLLLFVGLERFLGKPSPQRFNTLLVAVFTLVHAYFVVIVPSLAVRNVLFVLALILIGGQIVRLMLHRRPPEMHPITSGVGYVLAGYCLVSIIRGIITLTIPPGNDFFQATIYEGLVLLAYQMLMVALSFSLFLMVNRRLFVALERDVEVRREAEKGLQLSEEKFYNAFHFSPDAVLITRLNDGRIVEVNDGFCRLMEYSRQEALAASSLALNLWADPRDREKIITTLWTHRHIQGYELNFRTKSGKVQTYLYSAGIIQLGGEPHILSVIRDITDRKRAEELLRLRLKLWEYAAGHSIGELMQEALDEIEPLAESPISFYHFVNSDQQTLSLQAWSTRTLAEFCKATGKNLHYPISQAGVWADCVHELKPVIHNDYASLPHKKKLPEGHAEVIRELVVPILRENRVVAILGVGNKRTPYDERDVALISDIADVIWTIVEKKQSDEQIRQLNAKLEQLAMTDELTGLENRRPFFMRGKEEIKEAQRHHTTFSLLMLDIDHFKQVNDTHGHEVGDMILRCIARTLQENIREVDHLARLGGEEFGILLPSTRAGEAVQLGERLRSAIEETRCTCRDQTLSVTISIGVATYREEILSFDGVLGMADQAMYRAKSLGRNQVVYFDSEGGS